MDTRFAKIGVDISRYLAILVAEYVTQSSSGSFSVPLVIVASRFMREALTYATKLPHKEVFGLAQIQEVLDRVPIFLGKVVSMRSVECFCLLERSDAFIGDEKLVVAAVVVGKDQDFIAAWLQDSRFDRRQSFGLDPG